MDWSKGWGNIKGKVHTLQAVKWRTAPNWWRIRDTRGEMILIMLNDPQAAFQLDGDYFTLVGANEYGHAAVIAAFDRLRIDAHEGGCSIDDIVVETQLTWSGRMRPDLMQVIK